MRIRWPTSTTHAAAVADRFPLRLDDAAIGAERGSELLAALAAPLGKPWLRASSRRILRKHAILRKARDASALSVAYTFLAY